MSQFLANELIYEILRHFLPELQLSVAEFDLFPWYLGQICSSWRTVFISSPQFWSTLDINIDACREEELPYHDSIFELVKLALKRSNGYPLSLSITMHWVFEGDTAATIRMRTKDILEMLVAHSMNWKDLRLALHHSCYPTLYRAKGQLPFLRSIEAPLTTLKFPIQQIGWDSIDFQDLFTNATQLTRVHFFAVKVYWSINWSPMTVIHLVNVLSLDGVIPTLRQTSALEELVIGIIHNPGSLSPAPVHLPFLKMLYFPTLMLLSLLHTPRLEALYGALLIFDHVAL